jgi:hypothetical protein
MCLLRAYRLFHTRQPLSQLRQPFVARPRGRDEPPQRLDDVEALAQLEADPHG